jgi:hypothetical protein
VFRPGEFVPVRSAADEPRGIWWAAIRDERNPVMFEPLGSALRADGFIMPDFANRSDTHYVEVTYSRTGSGHTPAWATARVHNPVDDGYIRSWRLTRSFADRVIDDATVDERLFETVALSNTFAIHSNSRLIDLKRYLSPAEKSLFTSSALTYAFVWIDSPDDRDALLAMHSDESIAAWLNGNPVWFLRVEREVLPDQRDLDLPKVRLRKGLNAVLIKTHQTAKSNDTWAFKARILQPDGKPMLDVTPRVSL